MFLINVGLELLTARGSLYQNCEDMTARNVAKPVLNSLRQDYLL